jgi:urea transport system permease protein
LTAAFPSAWLYFLGSIFVLVTLFLPRGVVGLVGLIRVRLRSRVRVSASPGGRS